MSGSAADERSKAMAYVAKLNPKEFFSYRQSWVLTGLVILFVLTTITRPDVILNFENSSGIFTRLLREASVLTIIGVGMTLLMTAGEFDLSVGGVFATGGILFATLVQSVGLPVWMAFVVVLIAGGVIGTTNGLIVTKIGVPSLITTIGMMSIFRGLALLLAPSGTASFNTQTPVTELLGGQYSVVGVPVTNQAIWSIVLVVVGMYILHRTQFGYHLAASGDDPDSAGRTGIDTDMVKIKAFVLTSVLAVFAGMTSISFFDAMFTSAGQGYELLIIAATVIGGTDLFGGDGTVLGMYIGNLLIATIPIFLVLNGFSIEIQQLITGTIIIVAVVGDLLTS
jgi:simple sugar transport system permease protein